MMFRAPPTQLVRSPRRRAPQRWALLLPRQRKAGGPRMAASRRRQFNDATERKANENELDDTNDGGANKDIGADSDRGAPAKAAPRRERLSTII